MKLGYKFITAETMENSSEKEVATKKETEIKFPENQDTNNDLSENKHTQAAPSSWVLNPVTTELSPETEPAVVPESEIEILELKVDPFSVQHSGDIFTFFIGLSPKRLIGKSELNCYVTGPSGTEYPVLVKYDPSLNEPNRLRCIWCPVETGIHQTCVLVGNDHVRGSPYETFFILDDDDVDHDSNSEFSGVEKYWD